MVSMCLQQASDDEFHQLGLVLKQLMKNIISFEDQIKNIYIWFCTFIFIIISKSYLFYIM